MESVLSRYLAVLTLFAASWAEARKIDFQDMQSGFLIGVGNYQASGYDPVSKLAGTGVTPSGSSSSYLIPAKLGYFQDYPHAGVEIYFRELFNSSALWTTKGAYVGSGKSTYGGYGAGLGLSTTVWKRSHIRLLLGFSSEYMLHSLLIQFNAPNAPSQKLPLSNSAFLLGAGLQPEIYLGDYWALKLNLAYVYCLPNQWSADSPGGSLFGHHYAAGVVNDPATGTALSAQLSGILIETTFKLTIL